MRLNNPKQTDWKKVALRFARAINRYANDHYFGASMSESVIMLAYHLVQNEKKTKRDKVNAE